MQLCSGAVNVHRRDGVFEDAETVQSIAVNPANTILAVVTQKHLHFWTAGLKTVYLTSLLIPDTSLDDNPALFVIWRPRQGNHLAVVTSRQVVFFEADINYRPGEFLHNVERQRSAIHLHHIDSASRVCYSSEIRIETGLTTFAVAAGPYAFLVTTTAGVVYVVGWHQQDVLHQWTTVGLQDNGHLFSSSAALEKENSVTASGLQATSASLSPLKLAGEPASASTASFAVLRGSAVTTPLQPTVRVDPLQRRYQQPSSSQQQHPQQSDTHQQGIPHNDAASSFTDIYNNTNSTIADNMNVGPPKKTSLTEKLPIAGRTRLLVGGINPPGAAVRSGGERSLSFALSAAPTLLGSPGAALQQAINSAEQGNVGEEEGTAADPLETTTRFAESKAKKSNSFAASALSITDTASRSITDRSCRPIQLHANGGELLSGTILHASFLSRWKMLSFVFSSGAVLLCRPSCGTNFTHRKVQLQGCVTSIVSAHMVALNMRHLLIAVCTQAGALSCRHVDSNSLGISATPLWKGLRGLQDRFSSSAAATLGLISAMEWSPSEELLCVAFYKYGMVLVHYSGAVVTHHLAGPASAALLRSPGAEGLAFRYVDSSSNTAGLSNAAIGCSFVSWTPDGTRLWMAAPNQQCFFSTQLSRVLTADIVGPTNGCHTPFALLADNALYLVSVSEATERQGVRELVLLPEGYLLDQFPMLYGAMSYDGNWIACAGRRGVLIFNRDRFSWKLASKKQEEMAFSCVADPVWLRNIAVAVPALRTDTKAYELIVLSTSSVSPSHALARVALEGKPAMLSCVHQDHRSEGYLVMVDCNQVVSVFRYDAFMDAVKMTNNSAVAVPAKAYVALTPVQQLVLYGDLANPLQVMPVCMRREEDDRENPQRTRDQTELRLLLHRRSDHSLVWIRGTATAVAPGSIDSRTPPLLKSLLSDGSLPLLNTTSEPFDSTSPPAFVHHCWVDRTPPVRGTMLLTHEENTGVVLYHVQQPPPLLLPVADYGAYAGGNGGIAGLEVQRIEVAPTTDSELLPLCVSPFDGYLLCAGTDTSVPRQARYGSLADCVNVPPHPQLVLRPVLYAHRILSLLLRASLTGGGVKVNGFGVSMRTPQMTSLKSTTMGSGVVHSGTLSRDASEYTALTMPQVSMAEIDGHVTSFLWDRALFHWLEYMRLNDTFVAVMDYFLHTTLNESPPAAVPGLGQRSAIRAVIALLRNYPEFYTIVVGCVRKIDFTRWHLVLDFLGTPTALFRECVAHHCYAEAVHLVRVIMMGSYKPVATLSVERLAKLTGATAAAGGCTDALASRSYSSNNSDNYSSGVGSLEQASQCAIQLFSLSIENGDYTAAYDILRFMALLEDEIGMPTAGGINLEGGGNSNDNRADTGGTASESFLMRWLRQLTFGGAAYDDAEAAMEETPEELAARGNSPRCGSDKKTTNNQIGNYPTLVLNATRCEPGYGGLSAEDAAEEVQRQSAVQHMFGRHKTLPAVVHQEALRLLLTGYVTQLVKLMETFSLSVIHFIQAASKIVNLSTPADADADGSRINEGAGNMGDDYTLHLHEVFDGLHKELGLPRTFHVPNTAAATTAWNSRIVDHESARAKSFPGVLSTTNPKVWSVAQSVLYAIPQLRGFAESLHRIFSGVFLYNLAFCVLLMRKSDLISLLLAAEDTTHVAPTATKAPAPAESHDNVSPAALISVLCHLEALLAVPENSGYKPFLQDVFQSLPPSALRARVPVPAAVVPVGAAADDHGDADSADA